MSCDDKCKLPIGPPVVNRLCNISRKFVMQGDSPVLADHDIRTGECVVPNGYMELRLKEGFVDTRETLSAEKESSTEVEEDSIMDDDETLEAALAEFCPAC